jgi:UDP-N-acetylmuramoyl-L-alanyl-D-glutamate--2,6-diaminopimelate ligase
LGAPIYVDYAHTPDSLEKVLQALRPHTAGKLHVMFGCGGDRDKGKRPLMGAIAVKLADDVIVTDDNPRSEEPATIRSEILAAAKGAREIGDRAQAIRAAVESLGIGDVLVLAGKGHETGQYIKDEVHPFSDREQAIDTAIALGGRAA